MFAVTADQRDSRHDTDRVPDALALVRAQGGKKLLLPPERTAGDEIQFLTADAAAALGIALELHRTGHWTVGIGIGALESPLPPQTRAARGSALVHARTAVEQAKDDTEHLAVAGDDPQRAADAGAVIALLLALRGRRSPQGWAVADLLGQGLTQRDAATRLGITPAAVSQRARAAGLRVEQAALPAIERLLAAADVPSTR